MKKQKTIHIIAFLLVYSSCLGQNSSAVSLKTCIESALKNNPSSKVYMTRVDIARQQKIDALSGYLPQLNGSGNFDNNIKRQFTVIPAGAFGAKDMKVQFGNQFNTSLNLQADQVIYDQSLIAGMKANRPNIEIAQLKEQMNENDLIYNTALNYFEALSYKEQLNLMAEDQKKLNRILEVQKVQYDQGVITRVNYNRVQVSYNNLLSQISLAEANYQLAISKLKSVINWPAGQDLSVVAMDEIGLDNAFSAQVDQDIKSKPDYLLLERNIRLREIELQRKRAAILPTVSGYARYGANAFGNDLMDSYESWNGFSSVGFRLNVPLFGGLRRYSQVKQSEMELFISRQDLLINAESYRLKIQSAGHRLLTAYNDLLSNKNNIELAKSVFDDTSLMFEKGTAGLSDFLNAEYAYKEAQSNYTRAVYSYLTAMIDLEYAKGTIRTFVDGLK